MSSTIYIDRNRTLTEAQDYDFLRAEGQKYIESMSHKLWTDFNAHDPGITILEVLCYAITELGYRSNFDINDLLTNDVGQIDNQTFFKGSEILTNAALTPIDFRKILIDIKGVNNAWLVYSDGTTNSLGYSNPLPNEVPIFINKLGDKLSLNPLDDYGNTLPQLKIRGLNQIYLELGEDITYGQLSEVEFDSAYIDSTNGPDDKRYVAFRARFEDVDQWTDPLLKWINDFEDSNKIEQSTPVINGSSLSIEVRRKSNPSDKLNLTIEIYDPSEITLAEAHYSLVENVSDLLTNFIEKKKKVDDIYESVQLRLYENRNLTEDWLCLETVDNVEIGVCADIELATEADAEEVLAKLQEAIELILDPPIRFYTLSQMLDMNLTPTEIFSGPTLDHGFLLDEEVEKTQLPDCIHASDIIAAMVGIDGVLAVNNFLMTAYDEKGNPIEGSSNKQWCIYLNGSVKPILNFNKSKLLLFRDGIPFIIPESGEMELAEGVYYLKTDNDTLKLDNPDKDFPFPKGNHYRLDSYYSIQNDFPVVYGIGEGHLLDTEPDERKVQAKQLKGYLQHFDQILTDFFKQLHHAKDLLDIKEIDRTYFINQLDSISGIDTEFFHDEIYTNSFDQVLTNGVYPDDRSVYENDKSFFNRRNRFLDHLLARFGESFSDYVFMLYTVQKNAKGLAEITIPQEELIEDKQYFLSDYPGLSFPRGLGIDYTQKASSDPAHPWKLGKRGGAEKRIAALLGIDHIDLKDIVDPIPKTLWEIEVSGVTYKFSLMSVPGLTLEERWISAQVLINNITSYRVQTFTNSYIYFVDNEDRRIAKFEKSFSSEEEADGFISELYQALNSYLENFYVLEHILLRPMINGNSEDKDLLTVCLNDDCYTEANDDPYSFKATIVLPGWLARFRNRYFRRYAERLIRSEAPAHTLLKICWVGWDDMVGFQKAYKDWIKAYRTLRNRYCLGTLSERAETDYGNKLSNLVEQLNKLNTIYDEGTLHDCLESELDNPISLNNSSLGTLKTIKP